jgi:hypothetical protein
MMVIMARRLTTAGLWARRRRSLSAIWRISTAFLFDFFHGGETIDEVRIA